jgi:peptidoglycan/LPS O-acetylase OafA/YrhL
MPQLDGLRAFAVAAVAVSHWTPHFLIGIVPWGTGVQLFFVLSGFLITGILLRSRPEESGNSIGVAVRVFYIRRVLRIFPLYYGVVLLSLLFALGPIYSTWPWHVSYLSNIYYAWRGHPDAITDPFLHLWSLSVEEQFYLVWPWVALIASRRSLLIFLYFSIAASLAFRIGAAHFAPMIVSIRYLTPSCLDALAVGALIAHAKHYGGVPAVRRLALGLATVGGLGLCFSVLLLGRIISAADAHRVGHTFLVVFYGFIVAQAAVGFRGLIGKLLEPRPILFLGQISYGLYVFHYFAPIVVDRIGKYSGFATQLQHPAILVTTYTVFTLVAATVSWHFFELPINNLKRHFPYPTPLARAPLAPSPQLPSPTANV